MGAGTVSARCGRCGRYDNHLTERIIQRATPYQGEESEALRPRCLRLAQHEWTFCSLLCGRSAFDVLRDGHGEYPVCRVHARDRLDDQLEVSRG